MKIYTLPVSPEFQPQQQAYRYPCHNDAYDVEQDFWAYMVAHPELRASTPGEADWSYLPIFWTRWHMAHDYASRGLDELQAEVNRMIDGTTRVFTVCLYDDGPVVDVGATVVLTATRKTDKGVDIPTLCAPHRPFPPVEKKYRASFVGRMCTHTFRAEMARTLAHRTDVSMLDGDYGERCFVETMMASDIALCPRGYSASFRFFEAMQIGVVPLMISDHDTRPFKHLIDWDSCSMYLSTPEGVEEAVDRFDTETLREMGNRAASVHQKYLAYGQWCSHAIGELR